MKEIKKGDIVSWQGVKKSDTGNIESDYVWFATIDGGTNHKSIGCHRFYLWFTTIDRGSERKKVKGWQ